MPYIEFKNRRLFYASNRGEERGPTTLVLIHGAGGSHLDWPPQIRKEPYWVAALDLPGHGRSALPGCESIDDYAEVVRDFIQGLGSPPLVLAGHSMGGAIVQSIALDPPPNLKGLVLVASGSRLRVAPELLEAAPSEFEQTVDRIISFAWSKNSPSEVIELGRKLMLQGDPTTLRGDFLACNQFDLMQALEAIRLPTLIICGTEDRLTPPKFSQFMADGISQSRLEMVAGAGHMVMLEKPDEVTESITDFVLQCGSRAVS